MGMNGGRGCFGQATKLQRILGRSSLNLILPPGSLQCSVTGASEQHCSVQKSWPGQPHTEPRLQALHRPSQPQLCTVFLWGVGNECLMNILFKPGSSPRLTLEAGADLTFGNSLLFNLGWPGQQGCRSRVWLGDAGDRAQSVGWAWTVPTSQKALEPPSTKSSSSPPLGSSSWGPSCPAHLLLCHVTVGVDV